MKWTVVIAFALLTGALAAAWIGATGHYAWTLGFAGVTALAGVGVAVLSLHER